MALATIALAGATAFGSIQLVNLDRAAYAPPMLFVWLTIAGLTLFGLIWLYLMIAIGPRATVSDRAARKMERQLAAVRANRKLSRDQRVRNEYRITRLAARLSDRIDPAEESHNVFQRRVRLANSVLALICVLTAAFTIFAELAPQVWPEQRWYSNVSGPDTYHAVLFSADQILRGAFFDVFDVFEFRLSGAENDPENVWFSSYIVVYRFLMGGALLAAIAVRLGVREDWHEEAARETATKMKTRLEGLAGEQIERFQADKASGA